MRVRREFGMVVGAWVCLAGLFAQISAAQTKLAVAQLDLHQYEDGPVLAAGYEFLPGETAWLGCRMSGFKIQAKDEERFVKLSWELRVVDAEGILLEKPITGRIDDLLQPEDKNWQPKFVNSFVVPSFATAGVYKIQVNVRDELASADTTRALEFPVKAPAFRAADGLLVRNFRFLKEEDSAEALRPAVYHPGGMLWARFDIVGHKLGDGNKFDVSYGLAVLAADGRELFAQPDAAGEAKASFYPQRWVPGVLSLSLDKNVPAGTYTLAVLVRDKLAGDKTEIREMFQVE